MDAVELVVGGHDGPHAAFLHCGFEGGEVDFVEGALVDVRVDAMALELLVVGGEVLDGGDDAFTLHALDVGDGEAAGEVGIFAVALEVASPQRYAIDVDGRAEDHVAAEALRFLSDGAGFALDQVGIPRCRHGDAGGKAGGEDLGAGRGVGGAGDGGTAKPGTHAHGAVGHFDGGDAEALDGRRLHPAGAGEHGGFLFEGHAAEEVGDALLNGGRGDLVGGVGGDWGLCGNCRKGERGKRRQEGGRCAWVELRSREKGPRKFEAMVMDGQGGNNPRASWRLFLAGLNYIPVGGKAGILHAWWLRRRGTSADPSAAPQDDRGH